MAFYRTVLKEIFIMGEKEMRWNWQHLAVGAACVTLVTGAVYFVRKRFTKESPKSKPESKEEPVDVNFARLREEIQKVESTLSIEDQREFLDCLKIFNSFFELAVMPKSEGSVRVAQEMIMALTLRNCATGLSRPGNAVIPPGAISGLLDQVEYTLGHAIQDEGMHEPITKAATEVVPRFVGILKKPQHYRKAVNH